jgi:DNA-binding beta-propeller fold protein YncE
MRRFTHLMVCVLLGCALQSMLAGCAAQQKAPEPVKKLVWPEPPETARIEFIRSITSDKDLVSDTTFSQEVINFLAGSKPPPNSIIEPMGLAVSDDGQVLYVADTGRQQVLVFDFGQKKFSKIEGLVHPLGVALDAQQNLYVVDQATKQIKVFDPTGKELRSFSDKSVVRPTGIAIDRQRGKVYVVDTAIKASEEHTVKIFSPDGKLLGHIGLGQGNVPGAFEFATYIALDGEGNVYVTDTLNSRIQVFDPNGTYVRTVGRNGDAPGMFTRPKGVAVDSLGDLYVADSGWSNVQIFNQKGQVLMFFAGRGPMPGLLKNPTALAIDKDNHIYVADYINHRVEEYRLINTTLADTLGGGPMEATAGSK